MHHLKLNMRILGLAAAVLAVVLAAGSLTPRQTHADTTPVGDPTGVMCGYLDGMTLTPVGGNTANLPTTGTTLSRIDVDGQDVTITAVAYTDPTGAAVMPDCKKLQEAIPDAPSVVVPDVQVEVRPSVTGLTYDGANNLGGVACQTDFTFGGFPMPGITQIGLQLDLAPIKTGGQATGSFTFKNPVNQADCANPAAVTQPGGLGTIVVQIHSLYVDGPDEAKANFDSNWDKDGCLDWDELDPAGPNRDPFSQFDCLVGGIAEAQKVTGTPLDAADSSGSSAGLIAGVAAGVAALVVATGGAAWVTRKRWIK